MLIKKEGENENENDRKHPTISYMIVIYRLIQELGRRELR